MFGKQTVHNYSGIESHHLNQRMRDDLKDKGIAPDTLACLLRDAKVNSPDAVREFSKEYGLDSETVLHVNNLRYNIEEAY